ncbi:MAG: multiheme c-type cytochrome [Planctomycetota bacterium]
MKPKLLACLALSLLLCALAYLRAAPREARATFRLDLRDAESGRAGVELELTVPGLRELTLRSLLGAKLMDLSEPRAFDGQGRPLAALVEPLPAAAAAGPELGYVVRLEQPVDRLVLRYTARPGASPPRPGEPEQRELGTLRAEGCALALPSVVLVPDVELVDVRIESTLPRDWDALAVPPAALATSDRYAFWTEALIAERRADPRRRLAPDIDLSCGPSAGPAATVAVERVVARLVELLGAPRAPVHVVPLPPAEGGRLVDLPGDLGLVAVDLQGGDLAALQRFVRQLVPAWYGRTWRALELDTSPDSWFPLGLAEYLAQSIPVETGLVERDWAGGIENTWMRDPDMQVLDLTRIQPRTPGLRLTRRTLAATLVYELDLALASSGGVAAVLADYAGEGLPQLPAGDPSAALLGAFADEHRGASRPRLSFAADWRLELEKPLAVPPSGAKFGGSLRIAFTSDTQGFLEPCGCRLGQEGGVGKRAAALDGARDHRLPLFVFDLGNFSPVEREARLSPLVEEELALYVELTADMGYDAATAGPDELYGGTELLRSTAAPLGLPLVGAGVEVAGEAPFPASRLVERDGRRLLYIGFSENLALGPLRSVQERNVVDVAFPTDLDAVRAEVRRRRADADLVVVGGRFGPPTLRALCDPELGVDVVLLGGYAGYGSVKGGPIGFLDGTLVALDTCESYGLNVIELLVTDEGRIVKGAHEEIRLPDGVPTDAGVERRLDELYGGWAERPELWKGLEPLFGSDPAHRDDYVGAEACAGCHRSEYDSWRATAHADALKTLASERRSHHPKCVQCHVVGLGTSTGYQPAARSTKLAGVQCENCHGSGGAHVAEPSAANIRREVELATCVECHDDEHSDDFGARFHQAFEAVLHGPLRGSGGSAAQRAEVQPQPVREH